VHPARTGGIGSRHPADRGDPVPPEEAPEVRRLEGKALPFRRQGSLDSGKGCAGTGDEGQGAGFVKLDPSQGAGLKHLAQRGPDGSRTTAAHQHRTAGPGQSLCKLRLCHWSHQFIPLIQEFS
jgi:hypothetical protein